MSASELKPCPFCGGAPEIERYGDNRKSTVIGCTECGCKLENGESFRHGTIWNTRPDFVTAEADALRAEIERLRAALEAAADALDEAFRALGDAGEAMGDEGPSRHEARAFLAAETARTAIAGTKP